MAITKQHFTERRRRRSKDWSLYAMGIAAWVAAALIICIYATLGDAWYF